MALSGIWWLFWAILALITLGQLSALAGLFKHKAGTDRGSALAMVGAWYAVLAFSILEAWLWPVAIAWAPWLGAACFVAGSLLRWQAVRTLDRQFSPLVELQSEHQLVTHGLYARLRHPAYLGSLLWTIAVPLILSSASGLALAVGLYVPALRYRIATEERLLVAHFGSAYADYVKRVPALWPRLGRL